MTKAAHSQEAPRRGRSWHRKRGVEADTVPAPIVAPSGRVWSPYQLAIFNDAAEGSGHTVVRARAGTGKTTVICEALRHVPAGLSVLVVAFNNKIKEELTRRQARGDIPGHVDVKTCHGFGFSACMGAFRSRLADGRTWDIIEARHGDGAEGQEYRTALHKAVSFAKGTLAEAPRQLSAMLDGMLDAGQIEDAWTDTDAFVAEVANVLRECRDKPHAIDFDDMCWLPVVCGLRVRQYDRVFVDETQDLNAAQIQLVMMACKSGGRVCAVGDDRQAIYGFRGADEGALDNVADALSAKVLPLSVTYRCASRIVDVARAYVPDYQAAPGAKPGDVQTISTKAVRDLAQPGDFVISRKNAPLLGLCLGFLRDGIPASIAGRDVGANLRALIDKSKAKDVPALVEWLDRWKTAECARINARKRPSETAIDAVLDKVECVNALADGAESVAEVRAKVDALFVDKDDTARIVCTTVHKAKGLERRRAFVLVDTFKLSRGTEEENLYYVAVTRAEESLYLAQGDV